MKLFQLSVETWSKELLHVFRTIQRIPKHNLASFPVIDDISAFHAWEGFTVNQDVFLSFFLHFLLSVSQQHNSVSAVLFLPFLDYTQSVGLPWTSDQPIAQTAIYTTHNKHNRRTSIPSVRLEPTIPLTARLQNYALNCTTTKIGLYIFM